MTAFYLFFRVFYAYILSILRFYALLVSYILLPYGRREELNPAFTRACPAAGRAAQLRNFFLFLYYEKYK